MLRRKNKAQSVLEYTLILAVIIAAVVVAGKQFIKPAVEKGMRDSGSAMQKATTKFEEHLGQ